jgi:hypothetical protein
MMNKFEQLWRIEVIAGVLLVLLLFIAFKCFKNHHKDCKKECTDTCEPKEDTLSKERAEEIRKKHCDRVKEAMKKFNDAAKKKDKPQTIKEYVADIRKDMEKTVTESKPKTSTKKSKKDLTKDSK